MPSAAYSFIDVAVVDGVRQRFAAGDAIAVLSTDLEEVLWANGPGAAVLGYDDVDAVTGAPSRLGLPARRQIAATSGFPEIGRDRAIMVRVAAGMTSNAVAFMASSIRLPDGERAIMLAVPASPAASRDRRATAANAIGGFAEPGHFLAFVDARGEIEAATPGLGNLGIATSTLAAMVAAVRHERDRMIKRAIPAAGGYLPAGLARLTDDRHLLVVVDERIELEEIAPAEQAAVEPVTAEPAKVEEVSVEPVAAPRRPVEDASVAADKRQDQATHDHWYFSPEERESRAGVAIGELTTSARTPEVIEPGSIAELVDHAIETFEENIVETAVDPLPEPEAPAVAQPAAAPRAEPQIERSAAPVRFVWRTDAEGRFSAISPEFAAVVGEHAADIVGRRFQDVSTTFELDPSGEIAGLLQRRDTWSGRSVLWPVAGTDRRIPVDLAALPVYGRDRNFEGFRGFGVARPGEAVVDHERIGLALVPNGKHSDDQSTKSSEPVESPAVGDEPIASEQLAAASKPAESGPVLPDTFGEAEAPAAEKAATAGAADPFSGEVPALEVEPNGDRRLSDKVIRLAEHRPGAAEPTNGKGLSSVERSAFREIGEKLKKASEIVAARQAAAEADKPVMQKNGEAASAEIAAYSEAAAAEEAEHAAAVLSSEQPGQERSATSEGAQVVDLSARRPSEAEPLEDVAEVQRSEPERPPLRAEDVIPSLAGGRDAPVDAPILEQLPVPVLIHAGDVLHYANAEFLQLTGYTSVEELAEAGGLDALFAESYGDQAGADHDMRLRTRDGDAFPIEAVLRSVPWHDGKALMLVVRRIGDESADADTAEQVAELEDRLAEMRTIIDTATDGVVLIDRDGAIRSISRPAEALFGFDSDEVTGKQFHSLFAIESQRAARDYLAGLSEHGVASVLNDGREVIGRESQGRFIPLFMTIGRLPNDSGFCAVVRDITQWKRAEEELTQARALAERSSSQKTDFLARISHEIRTPLNAIIGFSELMVDEKFGPVANDRYRDYLRDINRSGNHVLDLVNDLLDISKIEAGQQEMDYEAVSLNDALAETVAMMQPQANRERVIIRSSFASRLPEIVADRRSIRQIALNILSNAVRYTQAGGQVIVSTAYETSGDIVMRVRDTGIGMSQAEIEQALKPFKQINSLKRGRGDGTGLGLPLTKAMVEANRARFSIASTPGEGTLVEVTFPSTRVLAE
ncbi:MULTISPECIES: PAS domain S-box protein [Hyphomicrobiales]|uniref:PAS domain S-box protein n=1 Tax=Hyphomicrobiales TaxID=356 RepID=UPI00037D01E1|nr:MULTISPECIES: PAS domain S-box protein [Phyllobacteriaceae]MCX8571881.1 PAS domain S-box protein [Aminobacter sp. MET-1]